MAPTRSTGRRTLAFRVWLGVITFVATLALAPIAFSTTAQAATSDDESDAKEGKASKGDSGESCTKTADCESGLKCISQTCIDPKLGVEGDDCERSKDCNAQFRCEKKHCVSRVGPKKSEGENTPKAAEELPPVEPTASKNQNEVPPGLEGFRGFRSTASIGAGGNQNLGFALEFDGAFRFSDWIGVSGWVGRIAGGSVDVVDYTGASHTVDVGYLNVLLGLHIGKALHGDLLLGYVSATGTADTPTATLEYSKSSAAYGVAAGYDIGLGTMWALTPRLMLLKASDSAVSDKMIFALTLGLTLRVPRVGD